MEINTVTVIGANGTMGCNVSAIFASFGKAKVYMVSRDILDAKKSAHRAAKSVRAGSIAKNLVPSDYSNLEKCISESDLVFESVTENFDIKSDITKRISKSLRDDAIVCSGTSGLSITKLSELFPESMRSRYMGVHMFNPPYNLNLCELIPTVYTDTNIIDEMKKYLSETLLRTVVEVKDSPAFLGNRIGFQFINQALQYADKYKYNGGIDYIDAILGPFTGRTMAPLVTSDFVGLDIHKAIVENIYYNTNDYSKDTFVLPDFAKKLVSEGKLGRKSNGGLYKKEVYNSALKRMTVYDITTGTYRDKMEYAFPFAENIIRNFRIGNYENAFKELVENHSAEAEICCGFLVKYIIYSLYCASEVGFSVHAADDVMATGFNWCPPLAMLEAFSSVTDFELLAKNYLDRSALQKVDIGKLVSMAEPSKYDYRIYFRSAR